MLHSTNGKYRIESLVTDEVKIWVKVHKKGGYMVRVTDKRRKAKKEIRFIELKEAKDFAYFLFRTYW